MGLLVRLKQLLQRLRRGSTQEKPGTAVSLTMLKLRDCASLVEFATVEHLMQTKMRHHHNGDILRSDIFEADAFSAAATTGPIVRIEYSSMSALSGNYRIEKLLLDDFEANCHTAGVGDCRGPCLFGTREEFIGTIVYSAPGNGVRGFEARCCAILATIKRRSEARLLQLVNSEQPDPFGIVIRDIVFSHPRRCSCFSASSTLVVISVVFGSRELELEDIVPREATDAGEDRGSSVKSASLRTTPSATGLHDAWVDSLLEKARAAEIWEAKPEVLQGGLTLGFKPRGPPSLLPPSYLNRFRDAQRAVVRKTTQHRMSADDVWVANQHARSRKRRPSSEQRSGRHTH